MEQGLQHRIRERAYALWDAGGRRHGEAEQHWLVAERQVLSEMTASMAPTGTVAAPPARRKPRRANAAAQPKAAKAG